jgi:hypothetical protein
MDHGLPLLDISAADFRSNKENDPVEEKEVGFG